jgi:hypothetical protein
MVFIAGAVFGFGLCLVMQQSGPVTLLRILPVISLGVVLMFLQWVEERTHGTLLEHWDEIRRKGKWSFIVTRYLLLRGGILLVVFLAPAYPAFDPRTDLLIVVIVVAVTALLGYQEWTNCEHQYRVNTLRKAANILRAIQN